MIDLGTPRLRMATKMERERNSALSQERNSAQEGGCGMRTSLFLLAAVLVAGSVAQADIIAWKCQDDGDGGIVMNQPSWSEPTAGEYKLEMSGVQNFYPAHMNGDFTTDTELDPTVWIIESVEKERA
jgi:hypothetical protein